MSILSIIELYAMRYKMPDSLTSLQYVELFHLLFLDQFGRKVAKEQYALKGGCNLRFFLKSIRYSQDMDLDIHNIRKDTLSNAVNRIFDSLPYRLILRSKGIEISATTESKQTDTTQRWKIQLKTPYSSMPAHTKIEFSRRTGSEDTVFEAVDPEIMRSYQLTPIFAAHYTMEAALRQKIWALILRTQTQARDVFDLFHLMSMGTKVENIPSSMFMRLAEAEQHAVSIPYESFKSQVVSYLPFDYQQQYGEPDFWDMMVLNICKNLKEARCD